MLLLIAVLTSAKTKLKMKKHSCCDEFLMKMQNFNEVLLMLNLVSNQQIHINVSIHLFVLIAKSMCIKQSKIIKYMI